MRISQCSLLFEVLSTIITVILPGKYSNRNETELPAETGNLQKTGKWKKWLIPASVNHLRTDSFYHFRIGLV
jgi:hypothetical protein